MASKPARSSRGASSAIIAVVMRVAHRHWCASRSVTSMSCMVRPSITARPSAISRLVALSASLAAGQFDITDPMVGTFYRAASPDAPPFVEAGTVVEKGQILCLIEIMKLFTTIYAERAGRIVQIGPNNGDLVEFGQTLFVIEAGD